MNVSHPDLTNSVGVFPNGCERVIILWSIINSITVVVWIRTCGFLNITHDFNFIWQKQLSQALHNHSYSIHGLDFKLMLYIMV